VLGVQAASASRRRLGEFRRGIMQEW